MKADASRRRVAVRAVLSAFAAAALTAVGYLIAVTPPTPDSYYPKCVLYQATGLHCPGCGAGRALHFLLNGRVMAATRLNAFALVALPVVGYHLARGAARWVAGRPAPRRRPVAAVWIWLLFTGIISFAVARNIPVHPFTLLAPHEL